MKSHIFVAAAIISLSLFSFSRISDAQTNILRASAGGAISWIAYETPNRYIHFGGDYCSPDTRLITLGLRSPGSNNYFEVRSNLNVFVDKPSIMRHFEEFRVKNDCTFYNMWSHSPIKADRVYFHTVFEILPSRPPMLNVNLTDVKVGADIATLDTRIGFCGINFPCLFQPIDGAWRLPGTFQAAGKTM